jgi:hypothetical protein
MTRTDARLGEDLETHPRDPTEGAMDTEPMLSPRSRPWVNELFGCADLGGGDAYG